MKNVLVFPCGSEIGLEIYKSISFSTHFNVIGGSSVDDHGRYIYENYIEGLPMVDDKLFIEKINNIVKKKHIDYIIPAHDSVVLRLAEASSKDELACSVITSPVTTCEISWKKKLSSDTLKNIIPVPKIFNKSDVKKNDFPLFLKPDVGQGSKGVYIAGDLVDIEFYIKKDPSLLILEFLPGKEYTIDCFTNRNGILLYCHGRERKRVSNGISVSSVTIEDKRFNILAKKINKELKFTGVWFFQVKENFSGELVLLEIAPRIAGTMGLDRAKGVNLPLLSLFDAEGYDVDIIRNSYNIEIDRALQNRYKHDIKYKHVYMDFDDLVIFDRKVNPVVAAFIFQSRNNNVKLHLITRHFGNLDAELKKYRLQNLFDEIIWLKNGEKKSDHITHKNAIFIDDSYAERKAVHDALGLPVFDAHAIEALIKSVN